MVRCFGDQLFSRLVAECPMVKCSLCAFYQPEFAEVFSMEIITPFFWAGKESSGCPVDLPLLRIVLLRIISLLKRGQEKLDWVISPLTVDVSKDRGLGPPRGFWAFLSIAQLLCWQLHPKDACT